MQMEETGTIEDALSSRRRYKSCEFKHRAHLKQWMMGSGALFGSSWGLTFHALSWEKAKHQLL